MPEIPEMELYKNNLNQVIRDKRIDWVRVYRMKSINYEPEVFINRVLDSCIIQVNRRGKYLIFKLSNGLNLLAHMMLDGRLYYLPQDYATLDSRDLEDVDRIREKVVALSGKPSVIFQFDDKSFLFFCQLTLGYLRLYDDKGLNPILSELGPDPLDQDFRAEDFDQLLAKASKKGMIKPWLMQQKNIAGVGNAYSNEALFGAGILPTRTVGAISESDRMRLFKELREVLKESIRRGGDMEEPFAPGDEFTGGFNPYFRVYDRAGKECFQCGHLIEKGEVGGRNAFFCPNCQS